MGDQALDQKMPDPELLPLPRVANCLEGQRLPMSVLGASPSLIRVLNTNRTDDRRFLSWQSFGEEVFLQSFRQSHQDIFGMAEVTTALEYVIHRLKGSLRGLDRRQASSSSVYTGRLGCILQSSRDPGRFD